MYGVIIFIASYIFFKSVFVNIVYKLLDTDKLFSTLHSAYITKISVNILTIIVSLINWEIVSTIV